MAYLGRTKVKTMYIEAKPNLFEFARGMRKNSTEAEQLLWKKLRKFRSIGFVFRRQHPIDFFIADFYCHSIKLVIEVDGEYHENEEKQVYDDNRSGELERFGIEVIRFKNEEILENLDLVISKIQNKIDELASPSLPGRGGREGVRP